ncbi:hypothetical protein P7D22_01965 [Lichenihabitans sp. Uapishka_5]|uniref:hypothetical protein n=1 Tax=Lichenihabitans sp. Uapishka_5 TaxID=3037302 RepID=UPI0029E7D9CC|nr:hypothetical protein [Lichenihabitans sp. Uapishka_5]MDX7949940.1 hypothetical protein [Lichenihabitans sp. Uapishka_5]
MRHAKALARQAARSAGTPFAATIVPTGSMIPVGSLREIDHANMVRRLKRALVGLPFDWMAGGFDYSLNEHKSERYDPHWLPHLYLIGAADDIPRLRHELSRRFSANDAVPRPVKVKPWDGRWNAPFYTLKVSAYRRVGVDDGERFDPKSGKLRFCRNTEQQRLRSAERLELNLHLDDLGISRRLFAARAQLHHRGRRTEIRPIDAW